MIQTQEYQNYGYYNNGFNPYQSNQPQMMPLPPQMMRPMQNNMPPPRGDLGFQMNPLSKNRKKWYLISVKFILINMSMILCWRLKPSNRRRGSPDDPSPHSNFHRDILSIHSSCLLYPSVSIVSSCTDFSPPPEWAYPPNNTVCRPSTLSSWLEAKQPPSNNFHQSHKANLKMKEISAHPQLKATSHPSLSSNSILKSGSYQNQRYGL